jgi:hypothetical protein
MLRSPSTIDSQRVLSDLKALCFASTPLRGAHGLDVASARAPEALTATAREAQSVVVD